MSTYQRKRPGLLHEIVFLVALAFMAAWELIFDTDSPSPWADAVEKHLVLLTALLILTVAAATMFFLYFAFSFGCFTGRGWNSNCTWASDWLARKIFS